MLFGIAESTLLGVDHEGLVPVKAGWWVGDPPSHVIDIEALMSVTHCLVNGADRGELKFFR